MNPELICPPYILWTQHVRAGLDSSSPDPRPIVARSQPSSPIARPVVAQSQPSSPEQHPSSPVARSVVAQSQPSSPEQHPSSPARDPSSPNLTRTRPTATCRRPIQQPSSHNPVPVVGCGVPVIARIFFNFRTRRRDDCYFRTRRCVLHTRRRVLRTHRRDPSRARPAPVRASPISTCTFSYFSALCQSIPACTFHGDCLRGSPRGASRFSSHIIHHH